MEHPLRILVLLDSADELQGMEKEMKVVLPSLFSVRVDNRKDFLNELITSKPGLILSDYSMPHFDAMTAMRLARQYHPNVPFIVVAGAVDEGAVVACLKSGADDFIMKNRVGRLGPAAEAAIRGRRAAEETAKAGETLRESENRYRRLFETAQEAVLLLDSESGNITDINPFGLKWVGRTKQEVLGRNLFEAGFVSDPLLFRRIQDGLQSGETVTFEETAPASENGPGRGIEISCNRILLDERGVIHCTLRDITQRRIAEEEKVKMKAQLFQAQKMEAIGAVAGGVAHDFNNLMTAIQISTDLAMMKIDESHELFRELKEIRNSALRATGLIRQLLLFSRKHPMEFRTLELNPIIDNLLHMLHRLIGEDIKIRTDLDPSLLPVRADASNMEQVIMNFVLNGRDAMPTGGTLTIRTENVDLSEPDCRSLSDLKPGRHMRLSVSDTGVGMDADTLDHIFEPFFTTKSPGKGTGLGLSVVYGIVKQHEGAIQVQSEPGKGSTFSVVLPAALPQSGKPEESKTSALEYVGKGQTILLVEDEDKVRESAAKAMVKCGYRVVIASSAKAAMEMISREEGRFDLVFTDVVLSDRTGIDLAEEILAGHPDMRILLCSGYTDQKSQWPIIRERGFRFLQKPYDLAGLLRALHEALQ